MNNETLRKKFFEECTDKSGYIPKINRMPNDVFEWIEDNCLKDKWISIKDKLPPEYGEYLISDLSFKISKSTFFIRKNSFTNKNAKFWMPLPNKPLNP